MSQTDKKFASELQPWKKYHRTSLIRDFDVNQKLYSMIKAANVNNLSGNAVNYLGVKGNTYTYGELFDMVSQLACAYHNFGISEGDTVLIATVSGVEEILNLLALNQLGAVSKWIDITAPDDDIKVAILNDNCRVVVCFAVAIPKIENIISDTDVEKVLYVEPGQFIKRSCLLGGPESLRELNELRQQMKSVKLPAKPNGKLYVNFMDFVRTGDKNFTAIAPYKKDAPALKIQSSGTTGKPKVIVLSDYGINCSIAKNAGIDLPFYEGNVLLKIAPAWVGYGLINSFAMPLAFGMEVLTTPSFDANLLVKMNGKYDVVLGVPFLYRYLAEHIDEIEDMSRPLALVSGGDKISKTEIETIQALLKTKNCKAQILNGAGCNEVVGSSVANPMLANRPGSIGIPLWNDMTCIFDPDTMEELPIGEKGEICYRTESMFLYYENNPEQTNDTKRVHPDGTVWIHTKDIGYQDEDGFVYIEGRMTRVITIGGFKISASTIEEALEKCKFVRECVAVAVPDKEWGEVPMLYIVLNDGCSQELADREIRNICAEKIKGRALPRYYRYIPEIPYTSNNKYDFRKLEAMGKAEIEQ